MTRHDYSAVRAYMLNAHGDCLALAALMAHTNLAPSDHPAEITRRLERLARMNEIIAEDIRAAKDACAEAGRRSMRVMG